MEKNGDGQEKEIKFRTAIRCAKAALMLSSLKNPTYNSTTNLPQPQDEEKIEMLKVKLVKEKQKLKQLRLWIGTSLLCYLILLLIFALILNSI